jgi:hypothetical protein
MPNITLSIRDEHTALWDYARRYAEAQLTSLSGVATMALGQYLNQEPTDNVDIIVVARVDDQPTRVKFSGRWLAEPEDTDLDHAAYSIRIRDHRAGVALTAKGRIAVYYQTSDGKAHLVDYDTLQEARQAIGDQLPWSEKDWQQLEHDAKPPVTLDI